MKIITMLPWLEDDAVAMSKKKPPMRGLKGEMHWYVELHVRGRTKTDKPGPGTVLGTMAEKALMVELSTKAAKNWSYMEQGAAETSVNNTHEN